MSGKKRILLVDDDDRILTITKRQLEAAGYEAITLNSPLKLPQVVQREKPDLILLDLEMPALTGEHVLDFATLFDFLRNTPIVLHSGRSEEEMQSLVARSHAMGCIRKTNNAISFVSQVQKFLDTAGQPQ